MPTITLKNVPKDLHARLTARAKANKRSLNQEAISCIEATLSPRPVDPEAFLERVRQSRERLAADGVPDLDESFLRWAREQGRA